MMMEFMHVGRHEKQTEHSIKPRRQGNVGMSKVSEERRDDSIQYIPMRRYTKHHDHAKNQTFSNQHITRVMPGARTRIDLGITMVYQMKLPKPLIMVQANVNKILTKKIQHNQRQQHLPTRVR